MANSPKYLDLIKVEYIKSVNGKNISGETTLLNLLSDSMRSERENIISLALLPLFNKDGSLYAGAKNPSDYIKDFPMLQTLAYPSQWEEISPAKMQRNNCPNLTTILRTTPENNKQDVSTITVKGTPKINIQEDASSDQDIETYGELIGSGSDLYSIIKINPMSKIKTKSSSTKKKYITQDELLSKIAEISEKLETIERKVNQGNNTQITKTKITNILNHFVGKITSEQLESIMDEIKKGIDVNISIETMEELNVNITNAINTSFNNIHAQIQGQENERYKQILLEIAQIKQNTADDQQFKAQVLELLRGRLPDLIATNRILTDKVFMKLGQIEASLSKEGGIEQNIQNISVSVANMEGFAELCMNELGVIHGLIGDIATTDEIKALLKESFTELARELTEEYQKGNTEFFNKISEKIDALPTEETIRQIAQDSIAELCKNNLELSTHMANWIVNTVIDRMGDVSRLDETDLSNITNIINSVINSQEFKTVISEIIDDKNLATNDSLEALAMIMQAIDFGNGVRIHQLSEQINFESEDIKKAVEDAAFKLATVLGTLDKKLDNIATKEDIHNLVYINENGEHLGLIPDAVRAILAKAGLVTKEDLAKFQSSSVTREEFVGLIARIEELTKTVKESGGTVVNNYYTQQTPQITVPNGPNIDIQQIVQLLQNSVTNSVNNFVINNMISQMYMQSMMMGGMGQQIQIGGYQPIIALLTQALQGQVIGMQQQNNVENNQLTNILNLMIKNWGVLQSTNPEVDKLKAELDELKKKQQQDIDELKKMLADMMEEIKKLKAPTPEVKKVEPKPKPEPKPIELPKPVGKKKLVKGTIEHLARVQEPKLPLGKRIWKFIVRHPFRAAAIGLGVGTLGVAGAALVASSIAAGGIAAGATALVTNANFFLPSIAIGAGVGGGTLLTTGAIGAIVSKFSKKGKKERLYTKFLKQKSQCDDLAEEIELKHEKQQEMETKIQEDREKQRNGNKFLKKLGFYKHAKKAHRKKLRKLRAQARNLENQRDAKVADAISTKSQLNAMERSSGKSLAMGGQLDTLRRKRAEIESQLSNPYLTEEDRQDLEEDLQDVLEDAEDEVGGITGLSDEYETFDTEAEELIQSVKRPTATMQDILTNLQAKNSKRTLHAEEIPTFDDAKVAEYLAAARASKNPKDQANAEQVARYMAELKAQKTDVETLINEGKISRHLANQLMTQKTVVVPSTERVDIEFTEESGKGMDGK